MRPLQPSVSARAVAALLSWALSACGGTTEPGYGGAPTLLFVSFGMQPSTVGQLYLTDARGAAAQTFGARRALAQPTLSPDGRRIAFMGAEDGFQGVHVMSVDGTGDVRVSPSGHTGSAPSWSPDGTRIAFSYYGGTPTAPASGLYVMNADGSGLRLVAPVAVYASPIAWSPDGTSLAFATGTRTAPFAVGIHVVPVAGGTPRLLRTPDCGDISPAWSPDGSRIALTSCVTTANGESWRIVAVNVDGTTPTTITELPGADRASWSPDGRWIAFEAGAPVPGPSDQPRSFSVEVHVVPATGGTPRVVSLGNPGHDGRPQWVPAGATLP